MTCFFRADFLTKVKMTFPNFVSRGVCSTRFNFGMIGWGYMCACVRVCVCVCVCALFIDGALSRFGPLIPFTKCVGIITTPPPHKSAARNNSNKQASVSPTLAHQAQRAHDAIAQRDATFDLQWHTGLFGYSPGTVGVAFKLAMTVPQTPRFIHIASHGLPSGVGWADWQIQRGGGGQ